MRKSSRRSRKYPGRLRLWLRRGLILATVLLLAGTLYFAVVSDAPLPDHPMLHGRNDLVMHVAAFLALTVPVWLLWPRNLAIGALVGGAALIEAIQLFMPDRSADLVDFMASVAGILAGWGLVALWQRSLRSILEHHHE